MSEDKCGTYAGYQRHIRRMETPCSACRSANAGRIRDYRAANPAKVVANRRAATAAARAQQRLADTHPALYRALLDEERIKLGLPAGDR